MTVQPPSRSLIWPNLGEFYRPLMDVMGPGRDIWEDASQRAASLGVFWGGDQEKLLITPRGLDCGLYRDLQELLSPQRIVAISADSASTDLGRAALISPTIRAKIMEWTEEETVVRAWGESPGLRQLIRTLDMEGRSVLTELSDSSRAWVGTYIDSKVGFRDFVTRSPALANVVHLPDGWICHDLTQAERVASAMLHRGTGTILKADRGAGGMGLACVSPNTGVQRLHHCVSVASRIFPALCSGPVVVEEAIQRINGIHGLPSVLACVGHDGSVEIIGTSLNATTPAGTYMGALVGGGVVGARLEDQLAGIALAVGEAAFHLGFRGPFGVDALLTDGAGLFCLEINARRTFVSHLFDIAARLFGTDWQRCAAIASAEAVRVPVENPTYDSLRAMLTPHWPCQANGFRGTFISAYSKGAGALPPRVHLVAMGSNAADAVSLLLKAASLIRVSTYALERAFARGYEI